MTLSPARTRARVDIESILEGLGADVIHVPVIQPADAFLDTAGEQLRRRIFLTASEDGETLCLRPEFTIPVCLIHIARRAATPARYGYAGTVFRQRRMGANEFGQAGIEDLGDTDHARADARSLADALAFMAQAAPDAELAVMLGDQAVFEAVMEALGLPQAWRARLLHMFGDRTRLDAALSELAAPRVAANLPPQVEALLAVGDEAALAELVETELAVAGLAAAGGRSAAEIAARLVARKRLADVRLDAGARDALAGFLDLECPLSEAPARLSTFAARHGIDIARALADFSARIEALAALGVDAATIRYRAAFGRPLDYYSGLVFEVFAGGGELPVIGGGRYDRLLSMLGAANPVPGVGFSVWLDRLAGMEAQP
ncbi:MAG TPA: ATP phosphoribosyltransferase regulatory subunit [Rhizobiaceae bacterium]|nr:ATP phosphoribosyltransferase regulatory subunit [Rhizobiaceae bacterium]